MHCTVHLHRYMYSCARVSTRSRVMSGLALGLARKAHPIGITHLHFSRTHISHMAHDTVTADASAQSIRYHLSLERFYKKTTRRPRGADNWLVV